jgi:hypothetical protein
MRNPFDAPPPTFATVARERRWTGPLPALRPVLQQEAIRVAPAWAWRILRGDASVAMRIAGDRLQGRIARAVAPLPESLPKWNAELAVFQAKLGWEGWAREDVADALGVAAVFTGPAYSLLCRDCGHHLDVGAVLFPADPDHPRCHRCAGKAKRKEAR